MHYIKKISVLFILLPLLAFTGMHKFYVSTTEVNYDEKSQAVQVISRVFADDLEKTIDARYGIKSGLVTSREHPEADAYLEKYYALKLNIRVNGEKTKFNYLGKEFKDDMVVSYLEIPGTPLPSSIEIENKLLYETYPEQQNIVHIRSGDTRKSFLLRKDDDRCMLKFKRK
ncbi:hypothetical protein ED312_04920 [Sinomicrobium pectinilyticum]|uniref:Peptidase E n=1 Tax=Sinomicrobium pectinilyticum TaxID=1084421 RepID=A0A3N0EUH5_SINP1|nr:DUF6702 family protein [Sinomicrobium pectinilyticum]RNL91359.1 hypothetical protein ED312_04920 [Sinomicrobium pectinilyticum]